MGKTRKENAQATMAKDLLDRLGQTANTPREQEQRHPVRRSSDYREMREYTVAEVDALCNRITRELKSDLAAIDDILEEITGPVADQLAQGAVADVFEAAAEVLKQRIRSASGEEGGGD